jgi:hypothetical protein
MNDDSVVDGACSTTLDSCEATDVSVEVQGNIHVQNFHGYTGPVQMQVNLLDFTFND